LKKPSKQRLEEIRARLELIQECVTPEQKVWLVCLEEALLAGRQGNYPVGAVITDSTFRVIARSRNSVFKPVFRSEAHAEMNALSEFEASPFSTESTKRSVSV
jgi:tRNA(Arg) A34 adenosine deaminase TadA